MAKAAIFDKDGVIVKVTDYYFEAWKKLFSGKNKIMNRKFHDKHIIGRTALENIREFIDPEVTDEKFKSLMQEYFSYGGLDLKKNIRPVKGVLNFLKKLNSFNFPTALGTSSRRESTDKILDYLKIKSYFRTIVCAENVDSGKPAPDIFLKAAQNLRIKSAECVVFEDSPSGVEAAKKAGMKVVLVMTSHSRKEIPDVDLAIKDFTQINVSDVEMI